MNSGPVLRLDDVSKNFGSLQVVNHLSFSVERGICLGLLGPNGAGKTTTVQMITAQYPYPSGSIRVFDMEVKNAPRIVKTRMGICPQTANLDPDFDVVHNLEVYAMYYGIPGAVVRPRIEEQLRFWGLEEKKKERTRNLSGGMVRRLLFARALINKPDLLILDEPTTGLDPQTRRTVWDKVTNLKKNGTTILLTTHYMEEAQKLCDRVVVMDKGNKLTDDTPDALIRRIIGHEVLEIEADDPASRNWLQNGAAQNGIEWFEAGSKLFVHCRTCRQVSLAETAVAGGAKTFTARAPNLEDVYLKLTGKNLL